MVEIADRPDPSGEGGLSNEEAPAFAPFLPQPAGIGGWLIPPLIGVVLAPLIVGKALFVDVLPTFQPEEWARFTSPDGPVYSAYWAPYLVITALFNLGLLVGAIVTLVLFLRRKRSAPFAVSCFYLVSAAVAAFELLSTYHLVDQLPALAGTDVLQEATTGLVRGLLTLAIWVPYFNKSVRVRNTFVR